MITEYRTPRPATAPKQVGELFLSEWSPGDATAVAYYDALTGDRYVIPVLLTQNTYFSEEMIRRQGVLVPYHGRLPLSRGE